MKNEENYITDRKVESTSNVLLKSSDSLQINIRRFELNWKYLQKMAENDNLPAETRYKIDFKIFSHDVMVDWQLWDEIFICGNMAETGLSWSF